MYVITRKRSNRTSMRPVTPHYVAGLSPVSYTKDLAKAVTWNNYQQADGFKKLLYSKQGQHTYNYRVIRKEEPK